MSSFALAGAPFWLFYNFISRAYGAALGSFLTMLSAITKHKKSVIPSVG